MKIVNILGGLGNQMFEYAIYLALQLEHPDESIKVCTRTFKGYGLHNGLEIDQLFKVNLNEASIWDLSKVAYPIYNYKMWQIMNHFLPHRRSMTQGTTQREFNFEDISRKDSAFYDGYWQNELYFKNARKKVLDAYKFPEFEDKVNQELADKLANSVSLSCHIRRGDYLKEPIWCVCTPDYYFRAIKHIRGLDKIEVLCVFSDDIPWCKENLKEIASDIDIIYVDWNKGNKSYCDMQLMTYCKHNIIANSSFSWWGAWLGQRDGKIVCAPKVWANKPIVNDPICNNWTRIDF